MTWAWIYWAEKHCRPEADVEIANEVNQAYHFYHLCISAEDREQGQKALASMRRAVKRKSTPIDTGKPRPATKPSE